MFVDLTADQERIITTAKELAAEFTKRAEQHDREGSFPFENIDGEPIQGTLAQFVAQQAALLHPRRVILSHHDNWPPGFSREIEIAPIKAEMARRAPHTELAELGYMSAYPVFA